MNGAAVDLCGMEEQLGLKLEPGEGQREFVLIERVESPLEN